MSRTRPQGQTDDLAFPVRIKVAVPPQGLGRLLDELRVWLQLELAGAHAVHSATTIGGSAMAIYLCSVADAVRLMEAFPDLPLADATRSPAYNKPGGR